MIPDPRAALLAARDARQRELERGCRQARARGWATLLAIGVNVPGPDKQGPGLERLVRAGLRDLEQTLDLERLPGSTDLLGPFVLALSPVDPQVCKRVAVAVETGSPAARLLDIDVYHSAGGQLDRAALGLPPRTCFLCAEPAGECIRLQRHAPLALARHVATLLGLRGAGDVTLDGGGRG